MTDISHHQWRDVVEKSQPNSISANALAFPDFLESTSTWNQRHIISFRMLDFNDLSISSMYPSLFHPSETDPVIINVKTLFRLSRDDVRKGNFDIVSIGATFSFYKTLQDCLRTQQKTPSPNQPVTHPPPRPRPVFATHHYAISDSSSSSFLPSISSASMPPVNPTSDKTETVSNILIIQFLHILTALETARTPSHNILFRYSRRLYRVDVSAEQDHFVVMVEGKACGSENDGSGWRSRWSESSGQWVKSGRFPLCSIEVHPRSTTLRSSANDSIMDVRHSKSSLKKVANSSLFNNLNTQTIISKRSAMRRSPFPFPIPFP